MKKILISGLSALMLMLTAELSMAGNSNSNLGQMLREQGFKHQTASWTTISTSKDSKGKTTTSQAKMWIKGNKVRLETKNRKDNKIIVFIDDGRERIVYMPDDKKAVKWSSQLEAMYGGMLNNNMVVESANQRKKAKKTGTGKVDGKVCDIMSYQSKVTYMNNTVTSDVKEWLWKKEGLPLKSIVNTPKHKMQMGFMSVDVPASETTNLVKDIKLNKPVKDSMFTVPKGTKIETVTMPEDGGMPSSKKYSPKKKKVSKQEEPEEVPAEVKDLLKGLF